MSQIREQARLGRTGEHRFTQRQCGCRSAGRNRHSFIRRRGGQLLEHARAKRKVQKLRRFAQGEKRIPQTGGEQYLFGGGRRFRRHRLGAFAGLTEAGRLRRRGNRRYQDEYAWPQWIHAELCHMRYAVQGEPVMRVRKPPGVQTKSFLFRPGKTVRGNFSIGLAIESMGGGSAVVTFEWCGSKRQLVFGASRSGFMTNLRLPQNLTEGDVYVLSVSARAMLVISVGLNGDEEALESIAIEELDDGPATITVCADPTTSGERQFDDELANGGIVTPTMRVAPLCRIESLRPYPESGVLTLTFRRPAGSAMSSGLLIKIRVGEMRNVGFIHAGHVEVSVHFRLRAAEAGEAWPLTMACDQAFTWSGVVRRNFDTNFLPAFSLVI